MSNYNLRRFSRPEGLKAIRIDHLVALLSPYREYFQQRCLVLPDTQDSEEWDLEALIQILMNPDIDTPKVFADSLYFIHEMATAEGMDLLLEEAEQGGFQFELSNDQTPADIAVQAHLQNPELLERKHAEQYAKTYLHKPRSFEYFCSGSGMIPELNALAMDQLQSLEQALDDWFEEKRRGRGCRVFPFPQNEDVWFLVRHGDPFKREGSLEGSEPGSVMYRPVKYDVLVYDGTLGELRINANSKKEKELYRVQMGRHLFGNPDLFPGRDKYTLEPLRTSGIAALVCSDITGIEWIKLTEIGFLWGGSEMEIEIRKAKDIFAAYQSKGRNFPQRARIVRASFKVKFEDCKSPRTVTIRPPNIAQYSRDNDSLLLEQWLTNRGFMISHSEQQ